MIDKDMNSACMQGGSLRSLNSYQSNLIMAPRSPHAAWQYGPNQVVKQEAMEEDKNDSGITSGSDLHSPSPGRDSSPELHPYQLPQNVYQFGAATLISPFNMNYPQNPLTPPDSEPLVSPKSDKEEKDMDNTLTPCASPSNSKSEDMQDHLRRLEMSLAKCELMSTNAEEKSDGKFDEQSLKVPKVNSHGKIKTFKCKQCDFVAITKIDHWNHAKVHIKEERRLTCPKCPFVTEYKHHLEYHLRNHEGSKPYRCTECTYTCVNKSMLNSHMKSHSSIYQYSCVDCSYITKYIHSLKTHLRKMRHRPNIVLDEQGNPCPDIIIDVHGSRRGPKRRRQNRRSEETVTRPEALPFTPPQLPFPALPFFGGFPNPQLLQHLIREQQNLQATTPPAPEEQQVLDLSKPSCSGEQQKSRRKGPAFRVDPSAVQESDDEDDDEADTIMFSNVEAVVEEEKKEEDAENNNQGEANRCQYCNIAFGDPVLHSIHMGYHGYQNPFTCNMCGVECTDKVTFFLHIARVSHS
ncbi:hunchback [Asbolus verrucosus]|uniref:Protein hunchback n=1 Tax=Asbolus verrucosus TaxID=1661398 RepID=A0A482W0Z4_ASBVE|nr:hunchback [Asbolus verrucosus]